MSNYEPVLLRSADEQPSCIHTKNCRIGRFSRDHISNHPDLRSHDCSSTLASSKNPAVEQLVDGIRFLPQDSAFHGLPGFERSVRSFSPNLYPRDMLLTPPRYSASGVEIAEPSSPVRIIIQACGPLIVFAVFGSTPALYAFSRPELASSRSSHTSDKSTTAFYQPVTTL
jgi:hypothetical protein